MFLVGTPEGMALKSAQHARITRDVFRRNSKGLYDEYFTWEDDDIDDSKPSWKKASSKNVLGAAWTEVAGACARLLTLVLAHTVMPCCRAVSGFASAAS